MRSQHFIVCYNTYHSVFLCSNVVSLSTPGCDLIPRKYSIDSVVETSANLCPPHMQLIVFQWTKIVLSLCYQLTNLHGRALLNYLKHRDQRTSMFSSFWMFPKNCCTLRGWGTSLPSPYTLPSFHIPGAVHLDSVIMWQSIKFMYLYVQRAIFTDNNSREVVLREYNPQLRHSWLIQQLLLIF